MVVSFIVTSYNYSEYIEQTIESIKSQSYKDFEIIVVDDFSTDNSVEILEKIKGIKLVKHLSNNGQLAAIISGLKVATGEFVSIIDSDDVLNVDYASTMLENLESNDVSFVNCNCKKKELISPLEYPFGGWWWSPMSCTMFRKKYLDCVFAYDDVKNWKICPDKFLFNIAYLQNSSLNIEDTLVYKREHERNFGKVKNRKFLNVKNNLIIRNEALKIINDKSLRKVIKKSYFYLLKQVFEKLVKLC